MQARNWFQAIMKLLSSCTVVILIKTSMHMFHIHVHNVISIVKFKGQIALHIYSYIKFEEEGLLVCQLTFITESCFYTWKRSY